MRLARIHLSLHLNPRRALFGLACLLLVGRLAYGGLVDFSSGLLDYAARRFGSEAPKRLHAMQAAVRQTKLLAGAEFGGGARTADHAVKELAILRRVNEIYNKVPYVSDVQHWGVPDYWATPVEMVASAGADCEDYAIAKYMSLKELGVPIQRLRITYVRALHIGETHMVLAYYPSTDADPWILDNLIDEVKPASARTDLAPVYSFNDDDLWLASGQARSGGASNVRLWREVLEKMEKERRM